MISLQTLNQFSQQEFVKTLSDIFEHSPWVAEQAYDSGPFESIHALHQCMTEQVNRASQQQRKTLICNHPELAGREAEAGELTAASANEQAGAGLNHCSPQQLQRLHQLNRDYREKFDFPFVIAVKQLTRENILQAIESRLKHSPQQEFETCLQEIAKIAAFRLHELIQNED